MKSNIPPRNPPHVKLATALMRHVKDQLAEDLELVPIGTTTKMMDCVRVVGVYFISDEPLDKSAARELVMRCTHAFLHAFNECTEIQPYLVNRPFGPQNLDVSVRFYHADGSGVYDSRPSSVGQIQGEFDFRYDRRIGAGYRDVQYETYEEALEKVKATADDLSWIWEPSEMEGRK